MIHGHAFIHNKSVAGLLYVVSISGTISYEDRYTFVCRSFYTLVMENTSMLSFLKQIDAVQHWPVVSTYVDASLLWSLVRLFHRLSQRYIPHIYDCSLCFNNIKS